MRCERHDPGPPPEPTFTLHLSAQEVRALRMWSAAPHHPRNGRSNAITANRLWSALVGVRVDD